MGISEEELEGLSDEERAALEDDGDDSEILGRIAGGSDGDDDNEGDGDTAGNGDDATAAASADAGDAADAGSVDDAGNEGEDNAPADVADEFRPEFRADVPEGAGDRLAALDAEKAGLVTKFQDGEIDMAEFMAENSRIDGERLQLVVAQENSKFAESQNKSQRDQRWAWEQERFFGQEKATIYKDPVILAALDASVKQLAADPKNAKKPAGFFLEEADRQVRNRFNVGDAPAAPNKTPRQPDLSRVPKTLAQLPAAEMSETGAEEFAYLDKLDGIALEQALRKMTPEQEARYLGAAA